MKFMKFSEFIVFSAYLHSPNNDTEKATEATSGSQYEESPKINSH